jgi:hypothetical protein
MRAALKDEKPTPREGPRPFQKLTARVPITFGDTHYPRGSEVPVEVLNTANGAHLLRTNSVEWSSINHHGPKPRKLPPAPEPMRPRPTGQKIRDIAGKQSGDALAQLRGTYAEVKPLFDPREPKSVIRDLVTHATGDLFLTAQSLWCHRHHAPFRRQPDFDQIWGDV